MIPNKSLKDKLARKVHTQVNQPLLWLHLETHLKFQFINYFLFLT